MAFYFEFPSYETSIQKPYVQGIITATGQSQMPFPTGTPPSTYAQKDGKNFTRILKDPLIMVKRGIQEVLDLPNPVLASG